MSLFSYKLKSILTRILLPNHWIYSNEPIDWDLSYKLYQQLCDNTADFRILSECEVEINGLCRWVGNYPYRYGHIYDRSGKTRFYKTGYELDTLVKIKIKERIKVPNGRYLDSDAVCWLKDGRIHRDNGPAVMWPDGEMHWYKNGELHREDGPAIFIPGGDNEWWLNGIKYFDVKAYAKVAGWTDKQLVEWLLTN